MHDLIARGAPLRDVLVEVLEGIERYDPSVIACVVLLDRESSTLHSGLGPSLPPEWLAAIDGVVIGPNIGTCGAAAWSGQLTITEDIAEDPKWAPVRETAIACGPAPLLVDADQGRRRRRARHARPLRSPAPRRRSPSISR